MEAGDTPLTGSKAPQVRCAPNQVCAPPRAAMFKLQGEHLDAQRFMGPRQRLRSGY